jgi:purine-cytosine permease-like protein
MTVFLKRRDTNQVNIYGATFDFLTSSLKFNKRKAEILVLKAHKFALHS